MKVAYAVGVLREYRRKGLDATFAVAVIRTRVSCADVGGPFWSRRTMSDQKDVVECATLLHK